MDGTWTLIAAMLVIAMLLVVSGTSSVESRKLERRLIRLERKLDAIATHLQVPVPQDPMLRSVDALIRDGRKIQAIKVYREATGAGLKEAKLAVEQIERGPS